MKPAPPPPSHGEGALPSLPFLCGASKEAPWEEGGGGGGEGFPKLTQARFLERGIAGGGERGDLPN